MLLACGFLVSCFSVDTFAYATPQQNLTLSGGSFSIWWHSDYNGNGVSNGTLANDVSHTMTVTGWNSTKNSGDGPKKPKLDAVKIIFDETTHVTGGYDYLINLACLPGGVKFNNYNGFVVCSLYDQYNNTVWTNSAYASGTAYGQNGFLYCLMRDLPVGIDFKSMYFEFDPDATGTGGYPRDGTFGTGNTDSSWLQITQLEKGADADDVIKAIEDQTAADQGRYDDFTSNGSEQGASAVESTQQSVSEKIGILDFAEGVLSDFIGLFSANPGDATLTLPGFKWHDSDTGEELTVWEPQTFDFAFVEEHFGPLVSALRVGTVLTVYGALLWYLQAVFDRIFGGGDRN